jgi:putative transposase
MADRPIRHLGAAAAHGGTAIAFHPCLIEHHFQPRDRRGSASKHPRKHIVDAILYVVEGGIKWRMLPKDFPPWPTVYDPFRRWNRRGV